VASCLFLITVLSGEMKVAKATDVPRSGANSRILG